MPPINNNAFSPFTISFPPPQPPPPPRLHSPPVDFLCSVCLTLMSEPYSFLDQSFHLPCLHSFHQLEIPDLPFNPTPNHHLRSRIHGWCLHQRRHPPPPISSSRAHQASLTINMFPSSSSSSSSSSTLSSYNPIDHNQEPPPNPTPRTTHIETILMNLRSSRSQEALTALAQYTHPGNRAHLCHPTVLDAVFSMFFTHSPSTTTAAATFLFNLSTIPFNRSRIAGNRTAVACLLDTLTGRHAQVTPPEARGRAAAAFLNLSSEAKMGTTPGLIPALAEYWMDDGGDGHREHEYAGMALKRLVASSGENVERLLKVGGVVERMVGIARDGKEGRRVAFEVMSVMGKWEKGREGLLKGRVMEEMVRMIREGDDDHEVEVWCLEVMWGMWKGGMGVWEFKVAAMVARAEEVLREGKEEWGEEGRKMAREMWRVMRRKCSEKVKKAGTKGKGRGMAVDGEEDEEAVVVLEVGECSEHMYIDS